MGNTTSVDPSPLGVSPEEGKVLASSTIHRDVFLAHLAPFIGTGAATAVFTACVAHYEPCPSAEATARAAAEVMTGEQFAAGLASLLGKASSDFTALPSLLALTWVRPYVTHARAATARLMAPAADAAPSVASTEDVGLLLHLVLADALAVVFDGALPDDEPAWEDELEAFVARTAAAAVAEAAKHGIRRSPKTIVAHLLRTRLPGLVPNMLSALIAGLEAAAGAAAAAGVITIGSNKIAQHVPATTNFVVRASALDAASLVPVGVDLGAAPKLALALVLLTGRAALLPRTRTPADEASSSARARAAPDASSGSADASVSIDDLDSPVLYDSAVHGQALSSLVAQVAQYRAPSLLVASGADFSLGVLIAHEWPGSPSNPLANKFFGSPACVLVSFTPRLEVCAVTGPRDNFMYLYKPPQGSTSPVKSSDPSRAPVSCLAFGGRHGSFRLHLPEMLNRVHARAVGTTYANGVLIGDGDEAAADVDRVVVFGLGGPDARLAHAHALKRTDALIQQRRKVDRAALADNADRAILELAGAHDTTARARVANEERNA
ncbi:uncharacterized protein AMSG_06246 [Thecamonas trahens ATCC 50062]|uniref:TLDc domain-containing protein n=1 Tax=Thecamonas trahens ATCC 50062 TaxID=461836 RepID=A0A0L0DF42_THETB|nr:hypothetical protein AMSG_06246 [Thecamonas trahens ATCC 50062]KNC49938.1 hypothetical protein AMSG_06246 [Thecamonas trahens ATCC 50062]|eukprot:XP_013757415.1 hypothetical protein AMSG_06246 [Thecamonas trahens ATCC 50062]